MKPFSQWTKQDIEDEFHVTCARESATLQAWLAGVQEVSQDEAIRLRQLSEKLRLHVHDWNEEELKVYFIAKLWV